MRSLLSRGIGSGRKRQRRRETRTSWKENAWIQEGAARRVTHGSGTSDIHGITQTEHLGTAGNGVTGQLLYQYIS